MLGAMDAMDAVSVRCLLHRCGRRSALRRGASTAVRAPDAAARRTPSVPLVCAPIDLDKPPLTFPDPDSAHARGVESSCRSASTTRGGASVEGR